MFPFSEKNHNVDLPESEESSSRSFGVPGKSGCTSAIWSGAEDDVLHRSEATGLDLETQARSAALRL